MNFDQIERPYRPHLKEKRLSRGREMQLIAREYHQELAEQAKEDAHYLIVENDLHDFEDWREGLEADAAYAEEMRSYDPYYFDWDLNPYY